MALETNRFVDLHRSRECSDVAEHHLVAHPERVFFDAPVVHASAIGRAEVFDPELSFTEVKPGVRAREAAIGDRDIHRLAPTNSQRLVFEQRNRDGPIPMVERQYTGGIGILERGLPEKQRVDVLADIVEPRRGTRFMISRVAQIQSIEAIDIVASSADRRWCGVRGVDFLGASR
jgi:hypothetical protein